MAVRFDDQNELAACIMAFVREFSRMTKWEDSPPSLGNKLDKAYLMNGSLVRILVVIRETYGAICRQWTSAILRALSHVRCCSG